MKTILATVIALIAMLILAVAPVGAGPPSTLLDTADLSNANLTGSNHCSSFNAEMPGNWGGEYGGGAVTAFPTDPDNAGYCTFTGLTAKAKLIEMRVLDGIADDSFNVYVKNPAGFWVLVYTYAADPSTAEDWKVHTISGFPAGKGQGSTVEIKIEPTNVGWSGFATYGQLAVDYIKIYGD